MSAPVTEAPRKRPRGFETTRDMVLSMAVVGAVVLGVFWMVAWQRPEVQGPIRPEADVEQVFTDVRIGDTFPVLEPVDLPDGWTPTSAWFDSEQVSGVVGGGVLHVGYLTPEGSYAEVKQTDGDRAAAVDEWVDGAVRYRRGSGGRRCVGPRRVGGDREGRPGEHRRRCHDRRDRQGRPWTSSRPWPARCADQLRVC